MDSNFQYAEELPLRGRMNLVFATFVYRDNAKGTESLLTLHWREMDSNLYGAFSCQAVVLGCVLTVFCSERERPFFVL